MKNSERIKSMLAAIAGGAVALMITMTVTVSAAPPHPDLLKETATAKKQAPYFMTHQSDLRAAGVNSGVNSYEDNQPSAKLPVNLSPGVTGEFKILAVLVRFPDKNSATPATYFDDLMFDATSVSVRHYYRDASFGQLDIISVDMPSSLGWITAPQLYSYYVNNESGVGDSYPNNAQKLVEDVVGMIDGSVDFSEYDNDNNGFVVVMMVIHSGPGAELTGSDADMWSHQWSIVPHMTGDGVYVSNYTMQPEYMYSPGDMTIGVFAHELGHAFGLPDLYDTDYTSNGIGSWGLMSFGSWLGPDYNGGVPAHPCAWSRIQMGFVDPIWVSTNLEDATIGDVKTTGDIYRLWTSGATSPEYFLVENRQRTGYDSFLPGSGLLIWHIDETMYSNDNEWIPSMNPASHYLVALEQCDGIYELELCSDMGDANDVFPGSGNGDAFNSVTMVNSNSYTSGPTLVAVNNISSPAATMTADLRVSLAGGTDDGDDGDIVEVLPTSLTLSQNYPNPFNPTTTISFYTPSAGVARVDVYNMLGYRVKNLLDGSVEAGYTDLTWDGTNENGVPVASGIYLYTVQAGGSNQVKKMALVR